MRVSEVDWTRTPWVGWCEDSCRPGMRCHGAIVPLP
jgi:hypothetical protein